MKLSPPLPSQAELGIMAGSVALAVLVIILMVGTSRSHLKHRMGPAEVGLTDSLSNQINIGAGLMTAIISLAEFDTTFSTNRRGYVVVTAIFAALILLGPSLFNLLRRRQDVSGLDRLAAQPPSEPDARETRPDFEPSFQEQGSVWLFFVATGIALWGAFGQVLTLGMALAEMKAARVLSPFSANMLIGLSKVMLIALGIYALLTSRTKAKEQSRPASAVATPLKSWQAP